MNDPVQSPLEERLAGLRLEVPPARNLWPGIAHRLNRIPRRPRPALFVAAAAVAGACVAGTLTWAVMHSRGEPAPRMAVRAPSFDEPRNPDYVAARDSLEHSYRQQLALLDPATRARIEASLAAIRQAREDIRKTLASEPASPVLEQLWQSTWHDELDLYDSVVRASQPTLTRI
jgi:hypothetical protein